MWTGVDGEFEKRLLTPRLFTLIDEQKKLDVCDAAADGLLTVPVAVPVAVPTATGGPCTFLASHCQ